MSVTVTIKDFNDYGVDKLKPQIASALMADINALGVGKEWTVTTGYKDIYDMVQETGMPIAVTGITATKEGDSDPAEVNVKCGYKEMLIADENDITVVAAT